MKKQKAYISNYGGGGWRSIFKWIGIVLITMITIWGVTGGINWAITGQNLLDWTTEVSYKVGNFIFNRKGSIVAPSSNQNPNNARLPIINERVKDLGKDNGHD